MKSGIKVTRNEEGFTLIESLFSLYILTFVTTLFIMLLSTLFFKHNEQAIHPFELENAIIQIQNEYREANEWSVDKNSVQMTTRYDELVTYSLYNNLIRRQVAGRGHEVLLQNVSTLKCEQLDNGVKFIIIDLKGKIFVRNIFRLGE